MKTRLSLVLAIAAIVAVCGLAALCFAQTAVVDTAKSKVELITVYEKTFDKPVVDAIFTEAVMTVKEAKALGWKNLAGRKNGEKVKLPYPKVVFVADPDKISFRKEAQDIIGIEFYDKTGVKKNHLRFDRRKGKRAFVSKGGKYLLVSPAYWEEVNMGGGSLYRDDGTLMWKKNSGPIPVAVSDRGEVVGIYLGSDNEGEGPSYVTFYDLAGRETGRIENPYKGDMGGCSIEYIDEDYALVVFRGRRSSVILASNAGKIIWLREYDEMIFKDGEFDAYKDVGIAGVSTKTERVKEGENKDTYNYTNYACFIDWQGSLMWKVPYVLRGDMKVLLSSNNVKVYFISSTSGYLSCIRRDDGVKLWSYNASYPELIKRTEDEPDFYEVKESNKNIYIIGKYIDWDQKRTDGKRWYGSTLFIFNSENGVLINQIEYPNKRISVLSYSDNIFLFDMDANKITAVRPIEAKR